MASNGSHRASPTAAAVALAIVVVGIAALVALVVLSAGAGRFWSEDGAWVGRVGQGVAILAFLLSGALIVSRQPRNVIGWLLIIPGLAPAVSEVVLLWLARIDPAPTQVDPLLWLAIWFTNWAWVLLIFPIFLILLTFPNGRLPSPRWRGVFALTGLMTAAMLGISAFGADLGVMAGDEVLWSVPNPIGFISGSEEVFNRVFFLVWNPALLVLTVSSVAAVVIRNRRGSSVEREQLKWPLFAVLLFGVVYGVGVITNGFSGLSEILFGLALAAIPVSVAIAVLKYRLYEIDRIISRTVSYLLVVALLGAVFFGSVTLVTTLLPAESDLAIAASTLAVAALFNPLRRRVQVWIDRRFNRARYDAQKVMGAFAESLRNRVDATEVSDGWRDVVADTMQPKAVSAWIRQPAGQGGVGT